jgi:methyl-coenzyme M reductase beta subunit
MFSPESTSKLFAETYGKIDVFNKPINQIANGA